MPTFNFANFVAFSPREVSFSPIWVSYSPVFTIASLRQSSRISAIRSHRLITAVFVSQIHNCCHSLRRSLRSWNANYGRYLPHCAAEVHYRKFDDYPHQRPFKLMTGGAATAGTGGLHVSHWIESLSEPVTDLFLAETANTSLKLCNKADCTICSAKHTDTD